MCKHGQGETCALLLNGCLPVQCQKGLAVVVLQGGERSAFDDEAALKAERKAAAQEAASDRLRDAYNELKYTAAGKVCCRPVCEPCRLGRIRLPECLCMPAECASGARAMTGSVAVAGGGHAGAGDDAHADEPGIPHG